MAELDLPLPNSPDGYPPMLRKIGELPPEQSRAIMRLLCRTDLYFLLRYGLSRPDVEHPWLFARCREVQLSPDGHLDLWAREHYKSTIITFAKTLQDILASHGDDPLPKWGGREVTVGIFSHTRPIAKQFLRQIRLEAERNELLRELFPDVLWHSPAQEAPKWSEDEGLIFKRKSNPKEGTVEAWGLVDGQPTSKHFTIMVYDDVVTLASVATPEMIAKTTAALELSYNLGTHDGVQRFIGTRYHYNDTYREIMARRTATPRVYAATDDGSMAGTPVFMTQERWEKKRRDMGPYTTACQLLQNPRADENQGFREEWLRYYDEPQTGDGMNVYVLVDPANEKKKGSDYTAVWVVGLNSDGNYYALDFYRDRLNLAQRAELLFKLHRKWRPRRVGYERYGMQADIQHLRDKMRLENYRFEVVELAGQVKKLDRINRLLPIFSQYKFYLPRTHFRTNYEGVTQDLVDVFLQDEYKAYPVAVHDDMLDALSRICDAELGAAWPRQDDPEKRYKRPRERAGVSWMVS